VLTLPRLERIKLTARPRFQRVVAYSLLMPSYRLPPSVDIVLENEERLPSHPVIFAMNHTDRYNYFPFQYQLWRRHDRFTATWVKGKYYQNPAVAKFMEMTNNIPTVSRGYLISRDFKNVMGRAPSEEEYATLRRMVEAVAESAANGSPRVAVDASQVPAAILETPRDLLGRAFDPAHEDYATAVDELFRAMMRRFTALNKEAFDKGLDVLIFPQGTRSIRLSRGHVGISQIALKYQQTILPVGCSGSDRVYPTSSPWAKGGRIVYRFGEPIPYAEMKPFHIAEEFEPFTPEAEHRHRDKLAGLVSLVMERINDLVDEPYKFGDQKESEGVSGTARFV
jgi:1-acyl-sn-glycerol-3-phosphate acyltransferase